MAPLDITIPQTSTASSNGKTYTLYHISLNLPLRKHQVKKRYSQFVDLDSALSQQTGSSSPTSLPPKSWLKSTFSSKALTSERQRGLETYLQAILDNTDSKWRSSPAWRDFLNLPSQNISNESSDGDPTHILDPSEWLQTHREIKDYIHSARVALKKRDQATNISEQHILSAESKAALVRAAARLVQCEQGLQSSTTTSKTAGPSPAELRRRRDMLLASRKEVESLDTALKARMPARLDTSTNTASATSAPIIANDPNKSHLFDTDSTTAQQRSQTRPGRVLGGPPIKETAATRELDNQGVLQLQQTIMAEQDQDVLVLGQAVARMKDMGIMINEELVVQNEMLKVVDADADRVQSKIDVAKKRIAKIS